MFRFFEESNATQQRIDWSLQTERESRQVTWLPRDEQGRVQGCWSFTWWWNCYHKILIYNIYVQCVFITEKLHEHFEKKLTSRFSCWLPPNQVRTACSTGRRKARLGLRKCSYNKEWEFIYPWVKPVQGNSGNALCEDRLSHFSISHGGEYFVKRHRQCGSQKKRYYCGDSSGVARGILGIGVDSWKRGFCQLVLLLG